MESVDEKNKKTDDNIERLNRAVSNDLEKRIYHITERAEKKRQSKSDDETEPLHNALEEKFCSGCVEENKKYLSAIAKSIDLYDRLLCAEEYGQTRVSIRQERIVETNEPSIVAYLKNPLTDVAYKVFSKVLTDARVSYADSFSGVCEDVYYQRAAYCILPIENYEDGRLSGFMNMIRKYELKIALTCNVESANGKITKFALLKREESKMNVPEELCDGEYLEIGVSSGQNGNLNKIMSAAEYFGYAVNKVDSLPVYYSEKEYYFDIVFSETGNLQNFLCWLDLEMPRYEVLGIYTQLKV